MQRWPQKVTLDHNYLHLNTGIWLPEELLVSQVSYRFPTLPPVAMCFFV